MKRFLAIVAGSIVVFLAGAMIEEWEVFAQPWFTPPQEESPVSEDDQRAGVKTINLYLTLSSHLYGTGGDPRFAERIPASPDVIDETLREISYLRSHHFIEDPVLQRMDPIDVKGLGPGMLEIRTKEYWIIRRYFIGTTEVRGTRSDVVFNVYRLSRTGSNDWQVVAWEPASPVSSENVEGLRS